MEADGLCVGAVLNARIFANLAENLIVNFIDFRPFSMKFAIKFSKKTSDLGFVGHALINP